ncbi:TRAP transporter small permease [Paenibacillus ginsengihumi]|uniref:TRAP transporter small permease n=1 Tax=Paenibacillus ginsengihumi TaxID=431596 RepID=UPI00036BABD6|nr:TRAP transporter small permease [Paenibacillus ginsengihumi]
MKRFWQNFEWIVSGTAFSVMVAIVVLNVLSRFFLGYSFVFTEEIAYFGFAYTVFFGVCILYRKHALIAIDIIVDRMPKGARHVTRIINTLLLLAGNLYLLYLSIEISVDGWIRTTAALNIPYTYMYISATLAFAIMSVHSVRFLIEAFRGGEWVTVPPDEQQ